MTFSQDFFQNEAGRLFGKLQPVVFVFNKYFISHDQIREYAARFFEIYGAPRDEEWRNEGFLDRIRESSSSVFDGTSAAHQIFILDYRYFSVISLLEPRLISKSDRDDNTVSYKNNEDIEFYLSFAHEAGHSLFNDVLDLRRLHRLAKFGLRPLNLFIAKVTKAFDKKTGKKERSFLKRVLSCLHSVSRHMTNEEDSISDTKYRKFQNRITALSLEEKYGIKIKPEKVKLFEECVCELFGCLLTARYYGIAPDQLIEHASDKRMIENATTLASGSYTNDIVNRYHLSPLLDRAALHAKNPDSFSSPDAVDLFQECIRFVGTCFNSVLTPALAFREARDHMLFSHVLSKCMQGLDGFLSDETALQSTHPDTKVLAERLKLAHTRMQQHIHSLNP